MWPVFGYELYLIDLLNMESLYINFKNCLIHITCQSFAMTLHLELFIYQLI